jgi:hypothetical protein
MMTLNGFKCVRGISLLLLLLPPLGLADSGIGVDTWRANKLDPTGGMAAPGSSGAAASCDPDGTSWLVPLQHRSPTGNLYNCPPEKDPVLGLQDWLAYGTVEFGYVGTGADRYALWNRYTDWQGNQPVLGLLDLHFERPLDGTYAEVRGSRISDDDQYYQIAFGRAGAYKVEAFLRDMPNILSTNAKPIWNGVGGNVLTLPRSLSPGEGTSAQVAAVSAATPVQTLQVDRRKEGLSLSGYLTPHWTGYFNVSHEKREGARPYGGPFAEDWPPNIGAINETVKPIDDTTINLNTGLRFASGAWRGELGYSGSYYRDHYLRYSFQQPFFIPSTAPAGAIAPPITQGQMSMEPDNDYHNIHGSLTRVTPMNGELSLALSQVIMTQRNGLIPPTNCQGYLGWGTPSPGSTQLGPQNVGPQNPILIPCNQWNTSAALSQRAADVNMHNTLAQMTLALRPGNHLSVNTGLKYYRQEYSNDYIAYNPQNGYYGYPAENGAIFHTLGLPLVYLSSAFPPNAPFFDDRVRPFLLSMDELNIYGDVNWKLTERDSLGLRYTFDEYRPTSRERASVDDNSIKLTWVDKALDWLTFRANYTFLRQTGSVYNTDVYGYAFLSALPGFQQAYPSFVIAPETVRQLRKYDISDRTENKLDLMSTIAARDDLTITASLRGDWNSYPVQIGRQRYNTLAAQISADWAPRPTDTVTGYIAYDRSVLGLSSVAGGPGLTATCGQLGCPFYSAANRWWESDHEQNYSAGATLVHRMNRATLDLGWTYIYSRGKVYYTAASPGALVYPSEFATMGTGFPANTYRVSSATVGVTFHASDRISVRVFDNYETGHISDWHYAGFNQSRVVGNTLYTDGGPQSYSENLLGVFVSAKL